MALKTKYDSKDAIPANLVELYTERDGAWHLDVEGGGEKSRLEEQRANLAVLKERDELKKRFEGIDPDEVRKLAEEKRRLEEAQQIKAGEVDKVIAAREKALKGDFDKKLSTMASERDAVLAQLVAVQIDQGVTAAATKRGLRPTALPDITARARGAFKLVNGVPTAFEADGQTVRHGKDGVAPMTVDEWVDTQVSEAPHLFESNAGAGAGAGGLPHGSGGVGNKGSANNPFREETWNYTEQLKLRKRDPGLAARLKAAA